MRQTQTIAALYQHFVEFVASTRMLARWAIVLPQLELKIMAARHLHQDCAAADEVRQRLAELLHDVRPGHALPSGDAGGELGAVLEAGGVRSGLGAYGAFKHGLRGRLALHRAGISPIADEPTAGLVDGLTGVLDRQRAEIATLAGRLGLEVPDDEPGERPFPSGGDLRAPAPSRPSRDRRFSTTGPAAVTDGDGCSFEDGRLALLHVNLTDLEIATIEACARCILDFPDMPWAFVRDMARQCWDEARHAELLRSRFVELGGTLGAFRIAHGLWEMATDQPLAIRLGIHQRIGEWIGVDVGRWHAQRFETFGDSETASIFEYIVADEVTHVALGNRWIDHLCPTPALRTEAYGRAAARREGHARPDTRNLGEGPLLAPFHEDLCVRAGYAPEDVARLAERYRRHGSIRRPLTT